MSLARVQFFSISLDGFGTGEGQSHTAPFGHAGEQLHQWQFATRRWREMTGQPGGSNGIDNAFVSVWTFAPDGAATRIEMRSVFPTKEMRDEAVAKYRAIEGGQQTLSNLAAYVTEIVRKGVED